MGIGAALILIASGAILRYAFAPYALDQSINLNTIGLILMIVGVVGAVASLFVESLRTFPHRRR